ncbi:MULTISPECIES: Sec-independent protein translocase protein TatB [Psychrobacter]|jgi:sec-independent protein translocase protein TatB|uniref:Sec-independent protein translocase protein TatB n=1 Tax=Psychrobacter piscatorii TaxID=554343 RepID=A0A0T6DUU1_9GAMM|nr:MULTISPECIES: Sec-independent protein translocase protein TatB [Psychrobacter]AOY44424.1 sec-independent translocase [Psychrobacter sp. AntiMn-1]KRU23724.1 preprotein translocase subunit TatB [Psychrobacter piscatorii]
MFDIGFSELLLFGVIALIVLGPEKLPQAARTAGQWYAKIRRTVSTLQSEIEAELDLAETRQQMQKELAKIRQTEADMRREMAEMRGNMKAFESSQNHSIKTSNEAVASDRDNKADGTKNHQQSPTPKAFDYSYATDEPQDTLEKGQLSKHGNSNDDSDMAAPVTQILNTRPWENMWFRLGAYDKARRLPMPPYLPNYKADTLLNSSVSTQTSDNKQGTD